MYIKGKSTVLVKKSLINSLRIFLNPVCLCHQFTFNVMYP